MANTTWSTTDKLAVTLSGSNLIATSSSIQAGARAADAQITGKFYWETRNTTWASSSTGAGLAPVSGSLNSSSSAAGTIYVNKNGSIVLNGATTVLAGLGTSTSGALGALTTASVIGHAFNATTGMYWARVAPAGNWNGNASADPVAGIGGVSLASFGDPGAFPLYPLAIFNANGDVVTANFGDSAFTGTVPSGFTSGFTSGAAPAVNAVVTQEGVEAWASTSPQVQVTQIGEEAFVIPNPDFQLTQAGSEVWLAGTPALQLTQAGLEMWATVATTTVQMTLTQAGLEVWRTVADAPKGGPMISMIS